MNFLQNFSLNNIIVISLLLSISSCSNDNTNLTTSSCIQEENRQVIKTIKSVQGTIESPKSDSCELGYTIVPDKKDKNLPLGRYLPCNLPEDYKIDGKKVVFSGHIYETFETEDTCANLFELSNIE